MNKQEKSSLSIPVEMSIELFSHELKHISKRINEIAELIESTIKKNRNEQVKLTDFGLEIKHGGKEEN